MSAPQRRRPDNLETLMERTRAVCRDEFTRRWGVDWNDARVEPLRYIQRNDEIEREAREYLTKIVLHAEQAHEWVKTLDEIAPGHSLVGTPITALLVRQAEKIASYRRSLDEVRAKPTDARTRLVRALERRAYFHEAGQALTARETAIVSLLLGNAPKIVTPADETPATVIKAEAKLLREVLAKHGRLDVGRGADVDDAAVTRPLPLNSTRSGADAKTLEDEPTRRFRRR